MSAGPIQEGASSEQGRDVKALCTTTGATFHIHLWEDRTRGEQWVPSYDARSVALVSDDFLRIASNNAVDAGRRSFEFLALAPGMHRLVFEKRMGWKFTAEDRRVYLVGVTDGTQPPQGGSCPTSRS